MIYRIDVSQTPFASISFTWDATISVLTQYTHLTDKTLTHTATLPIHAAKRLQFALDLLEKYEDTEIGAEAIGQLCQTAFAFWAD